MPTPASAVVDECASISGMWGKICEDQRWEANGNMQYLRKDKDVAGLLL